MRKKLITLLLAIGLAAGAAVPAGAAHWYDDCIQWGASRGLITEAAPNSPITRAETWRMIVAADTGLPGVSDAYAQLYVREHGISDGNTPNCFLTREQGATMVWRWKMGGAPRYLELSKVYKDGDTVSQWAREAVAAVSHSGLMKGDAEGFFRAKDPLTQAQMLTVVMRVSG